MSSFSAPPPPATVEMSFPLHQKGASLMQSTFSQVCKKMSS
jgi:hypothetical protein